LLSSFEYSIFKYVFGNNNLIINDKTENKELDNFTKNITDNLKNKIISYAENNIYFYKILFQYLSNSTEYNIDGVDIRTYIIYINISLIINHLNEGEYNSAFSNIINLLDNQSLISYSNKEIIDIILKLFIELFDYDIILVLDYIIILYKSKNKINENLGNSFQKIDEFIRSLKIKFFSISNNENFYEKICYEKNKYNDHDIYISKCMEFQLKFSNIEKDINLNKIYELKNFIKEVKSLNFNRLKTLAKIKLGYFYCFSNQFDAKIIITKIREKNKNKNILLKIDLLECNLYLQNDELENLKKKVYFMTNENSIKKNGTIEDNYDFYYYKYIYLIKKMEKNTIKNRKIKEIFTLWIKLINLSISMFNRNKVIDLLEIYNNDFNLNKKLIDINLNNFFESQSNYQGENNNYHLFDLKNFLILLKDENKIKIFDFIQENLDFNDNLTDIINKSLINSEETLEIIYLINQNNKYFEKEFSEFIEKIIK
jgi:hypothetical protein